MRYMDGLDGVWVRGLAARWLLACAAGAACVAPAAAQQSAQPLADLVLATQLAEHAQAQRDPLALLVAARMARAVGAKAKAGAAAPQLADSDAWLAQAREWAGSRRDLVGLIEDAQASGMRGVVGSVDATPTQLAAKGEQRLRFKFEGDADAAVALTRQVSGAAGALDVDLYITDDKGAAVCTSERAGLPKLCRWAPRRSGEFSVRVVNRLDTPANFVLLVQ